MVKKVLLIAFKYPPYAGVGGFRWTKFSKYLAERGYKVHVVTVKWKQHGDNTFINDVQHPNIIIHRISSLYFHNFKNKKYKNDFCGNFKRFFRYLFFKIVDIIWYEDEAHLWGYTLLPFCKKLMKAENIKNVICTGHPFMANYWAAKLKKQKPEINLIQDIRDPWNDDEIRKLPFTQMADRSIYHENFALNNCDVLFAVTNGLLNLLSKKINTQPEKMVIPNGFDESFYQQKKIKRNFTLIYAGNLYSGREEPLEAFLQAIYNIKTKVPEIKVNFYGTFPTFLKKQYTVLFEEQILFCHSHVSPEEIQTLIHESFLCLQFNARVYSYLVSTKIYEYASLKRPTLSINYDGEIEDLIKKHDLGVTVSGDNIQKIENEILKFYEIWKHNPHYEISPKGLEQYHYKNLVTSVEIFLK